MDVRLSEVTLVWFLQFQSHNCSFSYQLSTKQHHFEVSRVCFGHSENIIDRRYAVDNSVDSITTEAKLWFEKLHALSSNTKSVHTEQSGISNCLPMVKLNDAE